MDFVLKLNFSYYENEKHDSCKTRYFHFVRKFYRDNGNRDHFLRKLNLQLILQSPPQTCPIRVGISSKINSQDHFTVIHFGPMIQNASN